MDRMLVAWTLVAVSACRTPAVLQAKQQTLPLVAQDALPGIQTAYRELFGVTPTGLKIELVQAPSLRPEYDHFDADRKTVRMGWDQERPAYSLWTLAHELAHAYQFHMAPGAYAREPSWIHEGLAEYAVWFWLESTDPVKAERFLERTRRNFKTSGAPFAAVFHDVYAYDWQVAYPACHLAVQVLAHQHGQAAVLDYFKTHGQADPKAEFAQAFGCSPEDVLRGLRQH